VKKKAQNQDVDLYRLFQKGSDQPVYLPAGKGLTLEEANRLSDALDTDTYVKQVHWAGEEE
jgi:hypothetical protein